MNRLLLYIVIILFSWQMSFAQNCDANAGTLNDIPAEVIPSEAATKWAELTLKSMYRLPNNTPTYASRALGYMGLTMYESTVHGSPSNKSLVGQLTNLASLPQPEANQIYNWILVLNASQSLMLRNLFPFGNIATRCDSLEQAIYAANPVADPAIATRSVAYGKGIAQAIFEWSKTDGGHQGYNYNFDPSYVFPIGPGYWLPPQVGQMVSPYPLHPHWGNNRTFSSGNSSLTIPTIIPHSDVILSANYIQFKEVYDKSSQLTQSDKNLAAWWADDPSQTYSPPGHSYNLGIITVKAANVDLFKASETFARVGMAVADAFISCWQIKYRYHSERPSSFIRRVINPYWVQFWPEPAFPAFISGHSTQSAATAKVLESLYGTTFAFTDNTWNGRPDSDGFGVSYTSRTFNNFWETAVEAGYSRILGGIHTSQDNLKGLLQGTLVGQNINVFIWH